MQETPSTPVAHQAATGLPFKLISLNKSPDGLKCEVVHKEQQHSSLFCATEPINNCLRKNEVELFSQKTALHVAHLLL